jgi:hypothetical protein
MWWEPESNAERLVAESVSRLSNIFLERIRDGIVFGVGAWFNDEFPRPLLLVNYEAFESPHPLPSLFERDSAERSQYLREWNLPGNTALLAVSRPEPSSVLITARSAMPIRSRDCFSRATLGPGLCPIGSADARAFLTVGHMFDGAVSGTDEVELIVRDWPWPTKHIPIGKVVQCLSPFSQASAKPAYDYAIVGLGSEVSLKEAVCRGVASIGAPIHEPRLVTIFGSVSGVIPNGGIVGSLLAVGDERGIWANSWLILPSGLTAPGDSGSLVAFSATGEAVGMIVGGSKLLGSNSYMVQYAQDMQSLCRDVIHPAGYDVWSSTES